MPATARAGATGRQALPRSRARQSRPTSLHVLCAEPKDECLPEVIAVRRQAQGRALRAFEPANAAIGDRPIDRVAGVLAPIHDLRLLHGAVTVHHDLYIGDEVGL